MKTQTHITFKLALVTSLMTAFIVNLSGCFLFTSQANSKLEHELESCKKEYPNYTELHCAIKVSDVDKVTKLIASGADVNAVNYLVKTKSYDRHFRHSDHNVDVRASMNTPLSLAINNRNTRNTEIAKLLVNKGADVNAVSEFSIYILNGNFESCQVDTPLSIAVARGATDIVKLLLDASADTNVMLSSRATTPLYEAASKVSDKYGRINKEYIPILKEFFAHNKVKEISKQVDLCIGSKPTREQAEWLAYNIIDRDQDIDAYKRTKDYIDSIDDIYRELNREENYEDRSLICSAAIATIHDASEQLPYIYDYCNGDAAAFAGGICQDTPEQVLDGVTKNCPRIMGICSNSECDSQPDNVIKNFVSCIQKFEIIKNDYVASSNYFLEKMQKKQDDNSELTKALHDGGKEAEKQAYENFIYWNSPRGKCESRCNNEYTQNTGLWNTCMSLCKDMRSDIIE